MDQDKDAPSGTGPASIALPYAHAELEGPGERALRRMIGWVAVVYGAGGLTSCLLHVGLAMNWLASPGNMRFMLDGTARWILAGLSAASLICLSVGGLMTLRRRQGAVLFVRAYTIAGVCVLPANMVITHYQYPQSSPFADPFSAPAATAYQVWNVLYYLAFPILVALLTLPPIARLWSR